MTYKSVEPWGDVDGRDIEGQECHLRHRIEDAHCQMRMSLVFVVPSE